MSTMNVLAAPPDAPVITIDDLESEIAVYESIYGYKTEEVLAWIEADDPRADAIDDAGFWRSAHEALERMKRYREAQPEDVIEASKEASNRFYALQSERLCGSC